MSNENHETQNDPPLTDISELLDEKKAVTTTHRRRRERELTDLETLIKDGGSDTRVSGSARPEKLDDSSASRTFLDEMDAKDRKKWSKRLVLIGYALVGAGIILMLLLPQTTTGILLTSTTLLSGVLALGLSFLL